MDPVWLWRWPEGCAEAIGTCWAAVELLADYPGLIFTRGEAVIYKWIEDLDPGLFTRDSRSGTCRPLGYRRWLVAPARLQLARWRVVQYARRCTASAISANARCERDHGI